MERNWKEDLSTVEQRRLLNEGLGWFFLQQIGDTKMEMNVKDLREYLADFQDAAKVEVVVNNYPVKFSIMWGGSDGCTKTTAINICFIIDGTHEVE